MAHVRDIYVRRQPGSNPSAGILTFEGRSFECRLGRSGIVAIKREGDGATPKGEFRILYGYFRKDRITRPETSLIMQEIRPNMGWCDASNDPNYNRPVRLPFASSHEKMMRGDRLYDVCLVLDYNIEPVQKHRGSAIFFHQTQEDLRPTEGCIAVNPQAMHRLLPLISSETVVHVHL